jgi:hypothetical protein
MDATSWWSTALQVAEKAKSVAKTVSQKGMVRRRERARSDRAGCAAACRRGAAHPQACPGAA